MSSGLKPKDKKFEHAEDLARMSRILARRAAESRVLQRGPSRSTPQRDEKQGV